eukprot:12899043-Heterocapsa_arctica.AAC.3
MMPPMRRRAHLDTVDGGACVSLSMLQAPASSSVTARTSVDSTWLEAEGPACRRIFAFTRVPGTRRSCSRSFS